MADWTNIVDSQLDPDAPLTSELAYAWRDNPIAIAEGALGAPRVEGRALGNIFLGRVFIPSDGAGGLTNCDRFGWILVRCAIITQRNLRIRYSNDNGATYGAWQNTVDVSGRFGVLDLRINLQTGDWAFMYGDAVGAPVVFSGTHTVPSDCNAFQFSYAANGDIGYFDFYSIGGLE